jgi:hypothetical protein
MDHRIPTHVGVSKGSQTGPHLGKRLILTDSLGTKRLHRSIEHLECHVRYHELQADNRFSQEQIISLSGEN